MRALSLQGRYENRIIPSGNLTLNRLKPIIFIILGAFCVYQTLGDVLTSIVSNSHFWKRPGARDMTILGAHVGSHILNIRYLEAYGSIWRYMKVCILGYIKVSGGIWGYM